MRVRFNLGVGEFQPFLYTFQKSNFPTLQRMLRNVPATSFTASGSSVRRLLHERNSHLTILEDSMGDCAISHMTYSLSHNDCKYITYDTPHLLSDIVCTY